MPHTDAQRISKKVPSDMSYSDIEKAYKDKSILNDMTAREAKEVCEAYEELQELFKLYPKVQIALEGLRDIISGVGVHAGGVCFTGIDMFGELPTEQSMSDSAILQMTQYDMGDISKLKILKIDLLGLGTLSIIKNTMDLAGLGWDWYDSQDYSDPKVYKHLRDGFTKEVFQFEKPEPTRMMTSMNVRDIHGLTAVNAGNRPGGIAKIDKLGGKSMVEIYEEGVALEAQGLPPKFSFGIPVVDDYLKPTYGAILYQEDMMNIAKLIAGYSDGDVDKRIRKPIAKFLATCVEIHSVHRAISEKSKLV